MRRTFDSRKHRQDDWSSQDYALLGAFAAGCVIFVFAFAYALGFGRDNVQTADASVIPPAVTGERISMIPTPR